MLKVNSDSCLAGHSSSGAGSASQRSLPSNGSTAGSGAELGPSSAMRFNDSAYAEGEALAPCGFYRSDLCARVLPHTMIKFCTVPYKGMCFNDRAYEQVRPFIPSYLYGYRRSSSIMRSPSAVGDMMYPYLLTGRHAYRCNNPLFPCQAAWQMIIPDSTHDMPGPLWKLKSRGDDSEQPALALQGTAKQFSRRGPCIQQASSTLPRSERPRPTCLTA